MGIPYLHSWYKWIVFLNHDDILPVLLYTFHYTKNDFVLQNSKLPVYQAHHKRNVIINPQKNAPYTLIRKAEKKTCYYPMYTETKNVHDCIETHQIYFSCWKKTYQLIWMSCKSMKEFCNFLTAKSISRNLIVFWFYSLQTIYIYIW